MRYQLEPQHWGLSDQALLADLRLVAGQAGPGGMTKEMYGRQGCVNPSTIDNRFGSWREALARAGLTPVHQMGVTRQEYLDDLRRVARQLHQRWLTKGLYNLHGRYNVTCLVSRWGSWSATLAAAGLRLGPRYHLPATDAQLLENIGRMWDALGRQPRSSDARPPLSRYVNGTYYRHFGTWRRALENFVEAQAHGRTVSPTQPRPGAPVPAPLTPPRVHRTKRTPSPALRLRVLKRDFHRCRLCHASPAIDEKTVLVIDHIYPWGHGGETLYPNLQTLCAQCNSKKSDKLPPGRRKRPAL